VLSIVTSKCEVKDELVRNMKIFFDGIMEEWSKTWHLPRRIEISTSISDFPKVYIVIFKSYFRRSDLDLLDAPAVLLLLLDLHISSITVTLYENEEFVAPLEVMRADHIYRVHIACFIHCMMRSVSAGKYPLCNDGTQYVWKDDYNIKIITVRWDPIERVQGIMAFAMLVSRTMGYGKVNWIRLNNNPVGIEWQLSWS
jgi:hypothetical protein